MAMAMATHAHGARDAAHDGHFSVKHSPLSVIPAHANNARRDTTISLHSCAPPRPCLPRTIECSASLGDALTDAAARSGCPVEDVLQFYLQKGGFRFETHSPPVVMAGGAMRFGSWVQQAEPQAPLPRATRPLNPMVVNTAASGDNLAANGNAAALPTPRRTKTRRGSANFSDSCPQSVGINGTPAGLAAIAMASSLEATPNVAAVRVQPINSTPMTTFAAIELMRWHEGPASAGVPPKERSPVPDSPIHSSFDNLIDAAAVTGKETGTGVTHNVAKETARTGGAQTAEYKSRKKRKTNGKRNTFSQYATRVLEDSFNDNPYPTQQDVKTRIMANNPRELQGEDVIRIMVWFTNRRTKFKKHHGELPEKVSVSLSSQARARSRRNTQR